MMGLMGLSMLHDLALAPADLGDSFEVQTA